MSATTSSTNNNPRYKKSFEQNVIKVTRGIMFALCVVSFTTTLEGLNGYVFSEYWLAAFVAASVQLLLFVQNLSLPRFLMETKKKIEENSKLKHKIIACIKQVAFVSIFLLALFFSVFFSFVHITNFAYRETRYINAEIRVDTKFRSVLAQTEDYLTESKKLTQLALSGYVSSLAEMIGTSSDTAEQETEAELVQAWTVAQNDLESKEAVLSKLEAELLVCEAELEAWRDAMFWQTEAYTAAKTAYDEKAEEVSIATVDVSDAQDAVATAWYAVDTYQMPSDSIVALFLAESLKSSPDINLLNTYVEEMNFLVLEQNDVNENISDYVKLVEISQLISITVSDYEQLSLLTSNTTDSGNIQAIETNLAENSFDFVEINWSDFLEEVAESLEDGETTSWDETITQTAEETKKWQTFWQDNIIDLKNIITMVPTISDALLEDESIQNAIDVSLIEDYDKQSCIEELNNLLRTEILDTNDVESAIQLLCKQYRGQALFAILVALLLDILPLVGGVIVEMNRKKLQGS